MIELHGQSDERASLEIKWDSVVEKVWKDIGGDQEEVMSVDKFGRFKKDVRQ